MVWAGYFVLDPRVIVPGVTGAAAVVSAGKAGVGLEPRSPPRQADAFSPRPRPGGGAHIPGPALAPPPRGRA